MKKIKYLIALCALFLLMPSLTSAASGTISVTGTSTAVVGNQITITVTLSSSTKIGSWQMNLDYDKNYLQLTSSSAEAGGTIMAGYSESGVKSKKYTFTFKALKTGSTKVSVGSYMAYDYDNPTEAGALSLSSSSKTVKIITQEELEASYSKDNSLKSLKVGDFELTPTFAADTLNYNVIVPEDTKEITIEATKNDSTATVSGAGTFEVTQGSNTFEVIVKAQNGSERTYKITIEVKDNNPINVQVDNKDYTVVKIKEYLPTISAYQETTLKINDFDIPAYYSDITKVTLVGLKDANGNIGLFMYDEEQNKYSIYQELVANQMTIYPIKTDKEIKNYEKTTIKIGEFEVPAYVYQKDAKQAVIYGINIETGEEGFYIYDTETQTFIKFFDDEVTELNEKIELYTYIIFGFIGVFVLMFIIIICLLTRKKKNKKNKKKKLDESDIQEFIIKKNDESKNTIEEAKKDEFEDVNILGEKNKKK